VKQPVEVLKQWIDDVNSEGRGLTEWELGFMENITEQFEDGGWLSEEQERILEKIYCNKVK
jgi:hypothetical protein